MQRVRLGKTRPGEEQKLKERPPWLQSAGAEDKKIKKKGSKQRRRGGEKGKEGEKEEEDMEGGKEQRGWTKRKVVCSWRLARVT